MDSPFDVVADPARRRLLDALRQAPRPVGELAAVTGSSQPSASRHLLRIPRETVAATCHTAGVTGCTRFARGFAELADWLTPTRVPAPARASVGYAAIALRSSCARPSRFSRRSNRPAHSELFRSTTASAPAPTGPRARARARPAPGTRSRLDAVRRARPPAPAPAPSPRARPGRARRTTSALRHGLLPARADTARAAAPDPRGPSRRGRPPAAAPPGGGPACSGRRRRSASARAGDRRQATTPRPTRAGRSACVAVSSSTACSEITAAHSGLIPSGVVIPRRRPAGSSAAGAFGRRRAAPARRGCAPAAA